MDDVVKPDFECCGDNCAEGECEGKDCDHAEGACEHHDEDGEAAEDGDADEECDHVDGDASHEDSDVPEEDEDMDVPVSTTDHGEVVPEGLSPKDSDAWKLAHHVMGN